MFPGTIILYLASYNSFIELVFETFKWKGSFIDVENLRTKADAIVRKEMRKFLSRIDRVRNKDRQDQTAAIKLINPDITKYLSTLDLVGYTIIPETDRLTERST